jgi:hypothetical protein
VEYFAPQGTPHNPSDICRGDVTKIMPSEGLNIITDTHLIIDGLHPVTYGRPIRVNKGEWISTDLCECIVDRQDDRVRRQSGKFKAVVDEAKEAFYAKESELKLLKDRLFASSSEEESNSNDGGLVKGGVKSVRRPCGVKQDGKQEAALAQLREEQKRRKLEQDDPTYVPEVPRKKNRNKKSAGNSGFDVSFVFLFFSISSLMNSSNI